MWHTRLQALYNLAMAHEMCVSCELNGNLKSKIA